MTSLRNKIIAGVIGLALTGTVGATAVLHDSNTVEETTTTTATTTTSTTASTTTETTITTTATTTTEEVTTTMTTTTTTVPKDDFVPIVTEQSRPKTVKRTYDLDVKGDDVTITQLIIVNDGRAQIYYRRGGTGLEEKWGDMPTKLTLIDADGAEATTESIGYPFSFFHGIKNPLSTTFTLKITFEDLEEQTIKIVLPDEFKQE